MRGKHRGMWQYLIDHTDDILKDYIEGHDPEDVIIKYKRKYMGSEEVLYNCYACHKYFGICSKCIIGRRVGKCTYEGSAFQVLLEAVREEDRDEFIKQATDIRDAW